MHWARYGTHSGQVASPFYGTHIHKYCKVFTESNLSFLNIWDLVCENNFLGNQKSICFHLSMFSPKEKKILTLTVLFRTCKSDFVIFTTPAPLVCIYTGKPIGGIITATRKERVVMSEAYHPSLSSFSILTDKVNLTLKKCWRQAPQRWSGPRWLLAEGISLSGICIGGR